MNNALLLNRTINIKDSIISSLKKMDSEKTKTLFVFSENSFMGMLTIGDIQRAILKNINLEECVEKILDTNKIFAYIDEPIEEIKNKMYRLRAECMPVIGNDGELLNVYFWSDLFGSREPLPKATLDLPVVIMAGGKGSRLAPLTNIYPKPLIPVGEKTIIETIMDKFVSYSCNNFYISVNYKAEMIKNYFDFIDNKKYNIEYFREEKPLGTAGSLRLLKNVLHSTFFVSNCDIMIYEDFANILDYHKINHNELTVVAAVKTFSIPYGTIETGENGLLKSIHESPNLSFKINTGLYILEPSLLNDIPDDFYHITDLMDKLIKENRKVGVYPISQSDWMDMGNWDEYLKLIKK